ncbi:MAG: ABC transporter permease [Firmicutes bacterium]|nr:ABC transporter permease [Bacillota bacterium]
MTREKIELVVKGYLLKDKKGTILTWLFLCFVTAFLLVGNQLFANVEMANRLNAEALEGKQHATYFGLSEEEFLKIKEWDFVAEAGQSFSLGCTEDGTSFAYIDEVFRNLGATVADSNIKETIDGRWAEKADEVVFTQNYMEKYGLQVGDKVCVNLTATDADTGDEMFSIPNLDLTIVGVIHNVTGFIDRKTGYVSWQLADSIIKEKGGTVNVEVRFDRQEKITEYFDALNAYLGYEGEALEALNGRKNLMLVDAVDDSGELKNKNRMMNFAIWLICVMVVYHIFYNRLSEKRRDFMALRKIGFQPKDLLKITGIEMLLLVCMGVVTGILAGSLVNQALYSQVMKVFIHDYDAGQLVSSALSWKAMGSTVLMILLMLLPTIAMILVQLRTVMPVEVMGGRRKDRKKMVLAMTIVSLTAILISSLGIQDNHSDEGILYVKTYVPGELQITAGSVFENMRGGDIPAISDEALKEMEEIPGISQIQDYEIDYESGVFLCEEKQSLNPEGSFYEAFLEMEQKTDGRNQCLYNVTLVATDHMEALVPSYDEKRDGPVAIMEGDLVKTLNLNVGDAVTLYDSSLVGAKSKDECSAVDVKLLDVQNIILSENHLGGNLLIVDRQTADFFGGERDRQVVNVWTEEGREPAVSLQLERLSEHYGYSFHSVSRQAQQYMDSDRNQKVMHWFFIILLAGIGTLIYFNAAFTNLLNRRRDFAVMHKIGIRKKEMYGKALKEGLCQGLIAAAMICMGQVALCISTKQWAVHMFAAIDGGVVMVCMLFPVFILYHILGRQRGKKGWRLNGR